MKRDDSLWKGILENVFDDFLRFFFKDANSIFDFTKDFQYLDKELEQLFPTEESRFPKFVDKLVKVFTKEGKEDWILVHIEIQGYNDKDFTKRMFTYFYRILDKYDKPVTAIVIFTDDNKKFHPNTYQYDYLGTKNIFQFNTYKIIEQDEELLAVDENPFAIIINTVLSAIKQKKLDDEGLYMLKYTLAKNLLFKRISKKKIDNLLIFLQLYVNFANPVYNAKFDQAIDTLTENKTTMGIKEMVLERARKEGLEKGLKEGLGKGLEKGRTEESKKKSHEFVQNLLLANRFTITEIANFANVTEAFVVKVQESLK